MGSLLVLETGSMLVDSKGEDTVLSWLVCVGGVQGAGENLITGWFALSPKHVLLL